MTCSSLGLALAALLPPCVVALAGSPNVRTAGSPTDCQGRDGAGECFESGMPVDAMSMLQVGYQQQTSTEGICDADSPAFDFQQCHELTVGVSHPAELLEPVGKKKIGLLGEGLTSVQCHHTFHALSLQEAEQMQPALKECLFSTWAAKIHNTLASAPCSEESVEKADLVVLPGYTATECNWPIYGGGNCWGRRGDLANAARLGHACRGLDTLHALRAIQHRLGKRAVVLENSPNPNGAKYDLPDRNIYKEGQLSFAFVGADKAHYRPGKDISVPPGPSLRCRLTQASRSAHSFDQALDSKAYLATFKGMFQRHAFRQQARNAIHDGRRIIIADISDHVHNFEDLLYSSVFALILRGDAIMTTRVNEAICSGGIPVLVTEEWIPPFNEVLPFTSFGLVFHERDIYSLRQRLEQVDRKTRERLRAASKKACQTIFQTIEGHALSLAQAVSNIQ